MTEVGLDPAWLAGARTAAESRFRIRAEIARGGMGVVLDAIDVATSAPVALKLIHPELAAEPIVAARFRREAEVLGMFAHPNIVRFVAHGSLPDGTEYIALELLRGETLGDRMRRVGAMEPSELAPVVAEICAGLEAAHGKGVVHRDLKPSNVFLALGEDGAAHAKLVDFGVALDLASPRLTSTGAVIGTPRYMAPEQILGRAIDGRTDVYALGVILKVALTAKSPFRDGAPGELFDAILGGKSTPLVVHRPDLAGPCAEVVEHAMAVRPEDRFASAAALAHAFVAASKHGRAPRAVTQTIELARTTFFVSMAFAPLATREATGGDDAAEIAPTVASTSGLPPASSEPPPATRPALTRSRPAPRRSRAAVGALVVAALVPVGAIAGGMIFALTSIGGGDGPRIAPSAPVTQGMPMPEQRAFEDPTTTPESKPSSVLVTSEPSGAMLEMDGAIVGNTPIEIARPADGRVVEITLLLVGYEMSAVQVKSDTPSPIVVPMQPMSRPEPPRRRLSDRERQHRDRGRAGVTGGELPLNPFE